MRDFFHSAEAHTDFCMLQLHKTYGYIGVGIYWTLLELLALYGNPFKWDDLKILTFQLHVSRKKLESIIRDFGLFDFDDEKFSAKHLCPPLSAAESALDTSATIEERSVPEESSTTEPEQKPESELFPPDPTPIAEPEGEKVGEPEEVIEVAEVMEEEKPKKPRKRNGSFVLDKNNPPMWVEPCLLEPFAKFLLYKKEKGQSYKSEMSAQAAYNKLRGLSGTNTALANAIVEQTMAANWQGLFPLKYDTNGFQLSAREIAERERKQGIIDSIAQDYREMGYDEAAIARMFSNVI